jgi:GNAT superfamily N-acetyltransferase
MAAAFHDDPVWGCWACPDVDQRATQLVTLWRFFVDATIPTGWVWITGGGEAASLWIPPGYPELPPAYEERLLPFLADLLGPHGDTVFDGFGRFDSAHPRYEPHYYLSLLAIHPQHRGNGHGMALLARNLAEVDRASMPAYLESTNPRNDQRYGQHGFVRNGFFTLPDGPRVATMWREVQGVAEPAGGVPTTPRA